MSEDLKLTPLKTGGDTDVHPFWQRGYEAGRASAEAQLRQAQERERVLEGALRDARPYVFQRVIPPGHPERDWRAETAELVLVRVDAALAATQPSEPKGATDDD